MPESGSTLFPIRQQQFIVVRTNAVPVLIIEAEFDFNPLAYGPHPQILNGLLESTKELFHRTRVCIAVPLVAPMLAGYRFDNVGPLQRVDFSASVSSFCFSLVTLSSLLASSLAASDHRS